MKQNFKPFQKQEPPRPKAVMQLIDAFCDTYKPLPTEDQAEERFTMRKLREYFQAWPLPKMPDPLPSYLEALEDKGYAMQTGYDGSPCIFCIRWKARGELCQAEETTEDDLRMGAEEIRQLIARRMSNRPVQEELSEESEACDDDDDE